MQNKSALSEEIHTEHDPDIPSRLAVEWFAERDFGMRRNHKMNKQAIGEICSRLFLTEDYVKQAHQAILKKAIVTKVND